MINEVLQWVVLAAVCFLVLGIFRHISESYPAAGFSFDSGPALGERLPKRLLDELPALPSNDAQSQELLVAFVAESCVGCQALLAELEGSQAWRTARPLALVTKNPSEAFRQALVGLGLPVVFDDGTLWEECSVTSTPLVIRVNSQGRVAAKEVTHRVDSVAQAA